MGKAPTLDPLELLFGCYNYDILEPLKVVRNDATSANDPGPVTVGFLKDDDIKTILAEIYSSPDAPIDPSNLSNPIVQDVPPQRDTYRPPSVGGGLKSVCATLRVVDLKIGPDLHSLPLPGLAALLPGLSGLKFLPDFQSLTLSGDATATLDIPTQYPFIADPTEIKLKVTSTDIRPSQIGIAGSIRAFQVFHGNFNLTLDFDRQVIDAIVRLAKQRKLTRREVEELLRNIKIDFSTSIYPGFIPIPYYLHLSASSSLPLHRPVLGALDEMAPSWMASLPDRTIRTYGLEAVPAGTFFNAVTPGFGFHHSHYGAEHGFSATVAGLAVPEPSNLLHWNAYAYADFQYGTRVSKTVDLNFRATWIYGDESLSSEPLQLQYLHAEAKAWLPSSAQNQPEASLLSGHNVMFSLSGTHDLLSGRSDYPSLSELARRARDRTSAP